MGDSGSIPESGRSPGEENGNPLQYSCQKIPWTEEPGGVTKESNTTEASFKACHHSRRIKELMH